MTDHTTASTNKLARLGLHTPMDLVCHLPLRYEDDTRITPIRQARMMTHPVQVEGLVTACEVQTRPRRQLLVTLDDGTASLSLRFLHFYGSQIQQLQVGVRVRATGERREGFSGPEWVHPRYKIVTETTPLPTTLTPIYPMAAGISQTFLRKAIEGAMQAVDWCETWAQLTRVPAPQNMMRFEEAVRLLHAPPPCINQSTLAERTHPAWLRIKFDELLAQQLSLQRSRSERRTHNAPALTVTGTHSHALLAQLPFRLTCAQARVVSEIRADLCQAHPMHRLLQGDVGSGKTIVAALAATQAMDSAYQVALMVPTEILAEQHYQKIAVWMQPLGVEVVCLTGRLSKKQKTQAIERIAKGEAHWVIGTHALIQSAVQFAKLGLVIVDEQHRFGVAQRLCLLNKTNDPTNKIPHQLIMSATPIPRTLAMTYYADLSISVIDELPPGRHPIKTHTVDLDRRAEIIVRVKDAVHAGRQIYWVCPLIEESDTLQLQTAKATYAELSDLLPEDIRIGLVHGRLKPSEKQVVMNDFMAGTLHVLVATTVIEVGVDVPNASVMIIEHAERFGLSQLHQLRGRIGRGSTASVCLLLFQRPLAYAAKQRLMTMRETTDGFAIARRDLAIRGPGEFLGARQSGSPMLRFADLDKDQALVEKAQRLAAHLLMHETPEQLQIVEQHLERWLGVREDFLKA